MFGPQVTLLFSGAEVERSPSNVRERWWLTGGDEFTLVKGREKDVKALVNGVELRLLRSGDDAMLACALEAERKVEEREKVGGGVLPVECGVVGPLGIMSPLHGPFEDPAEPKVFNRLSYLDMPMSVPIGGRKCMPLD